MSDKKLIIRASLLYEFKLDTSASSASCKLCTAFGECAVVKELHKTGFNCFILAMKPLKINLELDDQYL